jgi:regulator of RNase E activity RraA
MEIRPGDLLHGDRHGVLTIPVDIAVGIPAVAADLKKTEQKVIDLCQSSAFSVTKLSEVMKKTSSDRTARAK